MKKPIYFFYQNIRLSISNRTQLKDFIIKIFEKEKRSLQSLNYIFCSDDYLLTINKQYLQHNTYTDIISFEFSSKNEPLTGEIYISVDRVKDNAKKIGNAVKEEIHRVIFHGVLHLCGYKDKTKHEKEKMKAKEDQYLKLYFKK